MLVECKPEDIKALALDLLREDATPAGIRSGISRLYYAVFLKLCESKKIKPHLKGMGDHARVLLVLRKNYKRIDLANRVEKLRLFREHADYHLTSDHATAAECSICSGDDDFDDALVKHIIKEGNDLFKLVATF